MKTRLLSRLLPALAWGSIAHAAEVTVRLENPPAGGTVAFELFNSANTFGDFRDPVKVVQQPLDGRAIYNLSDLPAGEYALLVYYDTNNNNHIDKNFIGIPKEPLAFSNGYQPKGPPSYQRAAFMLRPDESAHFDVELAKPLGERGRLGIGLGLIGRSSPYRDYDGGVYQALPSVVYTGNRLQIYGPAAQLGLIGSGKLRLAAKGRYRMGAYKEDHSDFLAGMGDAESTFLAGLALQSELPEGVDLSASYCHDALDRIGGGEATLEVTKSIQFGSLRVSPTAGVNWTSSDLANNDFGVSSDEALPGRPAYELDSVLGFEAGAGLFYEITSSWILLINASIEVLDKEVARSPVVSKNYVIKGFSALSYIF